MGVTTEEARAKLSLDTGDLERGRRDIEHFSQEGHKSFLHVGNAARDFHKLLERITEQSPLLGTALKAALSPIGAALGGAALSFSIVNREIEAFNRRLDEIRDRNARSVLGDDFGKSVRERAEKIKRTAEEFDESERIKSKESANAEVLAVEEAERKRLATIDEQRREDAHTKRLREIKDTALAEDRANDDNYKRQRERLQILATVHRLNPLAHEVIANSLEAQHEARTRQIQDTAEERTRQADDTKKLADRVASIAETQRRRQQLARQHADILRQSASAQQELDRARANAANTRVTAGAGSADASIKALEEEKAELDKGAPGAQETLAEYEQFHDESGPGFRRLINNLRQSFSTGDFNVIAAGKRAGEAERLLNRRSEIQRQINQLRPGAAKLSSTQARSDSELNTAQSRMSSLLAQLRENEKATAALVSLPAPAAESTAILDPITGGYAYHGIVNRGGIAYRPLGGPSLSPKPTSADPVGAALAKTGAVPVEIVNIREDR